MATGSIDDREIALVRNRLLILVAALLAGLIIVLGSTVYFTAERSFLAAPRQAAALRARDTVRHIPSLRHNGSVPHTPVDDRHGDDLDAGYGDVPFTFAGTNLEVRASTAGPFGPNLMERKAAIQALHTHRPNFTTRRLGEQEYLIYSDPAVVHGRLVGVVQTAVAERPYLEGLERLLDVLLLVGFLGLLASIAVSGIVVNRALLPVRAALRRQREFVADAAHELRTPLTVIRTAAELGLSAQDTEEQSVALEQVLAQDSLLTRLVDDLSLLARADSGALRLELRPVDLSHLVEETVSGLEVLAEEKEIALRLDAARDAVVRGDPTRLRQLLTILLDNALKYTPRGGSVTIAVGRTGHNAQLRVQDSGPGISPEDLPHIFDRFYRAERARTRGEGSGLGLAIGRWISQAHGGNIAAGNVQTGGAVFTVDLPLA